MNQQMLEQDLEVSGKDINIICDRMLEYGVHGKLTGAGGDGGCVLGFYIPHAGDEVNENLQKLKSDLNNMGYTVYDDIQISKTGVKSL